MIDLFALVIAATLALAFIALYVAYRVNQRDAIQARISARLRATSTR